MSDNIRKNFKHKLLQYKSYYTDNESIKQK
jgi:hypothetical protein